MKTYFRWRKTKRTVLYRFAHDETNHLLDLEQKFLKTYLLQISCP